MTEPGRLSGFGDEIDADPVMQLSVLRALGRPAHRGAQRLGHEHRRPVRRRNSTELAALLAEPGHGRLGDRLADRQGRRVRRPRRRARPVPPGGRRRAPARQPVHPVVLVLPSARHDPAGHPRRGPQAAPRVRDDRRAGGASCWCTRTRRRSTATSPARVLDLIEAVGSPALRMAWDSANFVQVGVRPFTDGYALLRPYLEYLQVKDAVAADGRVVPAGEGDGELLATVTALRDDGYAGFASLEPHLAMAGALGGFSGPAMFGRAARAFATLTDAIGVQLRDRNSHRRGRDHRPQPRRRDPPASRAAGRRARRHRTRRPAPRAGRRSSPMTRPAATPRSRRRSMMRAGTGRSTSSPSARRPACTSTLVEQALAAGRHVVVEKPLDVSLKRARRLAGLAAGRRPRGVWSRA